METGMLPRVGIKARWSIRGFPNSAAQFSFATFALLLDLYEQASGAQWIMDTHGLTVTVISTSPPLCSTAAAFKKKPKKTYTLCAKTCCLKTVTCP